MEMQLYESDADLLDRELSINDPTLLEGLVLKLGDQDKLESVLFRYDVAITLGRPTARIHCAHCNAPKHHKGWVVTLNGGRKALIGKDCGQKQFALDFKQSENTFKSSETRKANLNWLLAAGPKAKQIADAYELIARDSIFSHYANFKKQLGKEYGLLSRRLAQMLRESGGNFIATVKVRDYPREEARIDEERKRRQQHWDRTDERRIEKELKKFGKTLPPIYRDEEAFVGPCLGSRALSPEDPHQNAQTIAVAFSVLAAQINGSSSLDWNNKSVVSTKKEMENLKQKMQRAVEQVNALIDFMSPSNLARIKRLFEMDQDLFENYRVDGNSITKIRDGTSLCLPIACAKIDLTSLEINFSNDEQPLSTKSEAA